MKTLSPHFQYASPNFNPLEADGHLLACAPNAISLMARKQDAMQLVFHSFQNEVVWASQLERMLNEVPLPASISWQGLYFSNKAVLVPQAFFDSNRLSAYTLPVFDVLPNERLMYHSINSELVQVFAMPNRCWEAVEQLAGPCTWAHPAGIMIPVYTEQAKIQNAPTLFVYVQHGQCAFTVLENEKVLAQFMHTINDDVELLYYTAKVLAQYGSDDSKIYVHGEWTDLLEYEKQVREKGYCLESLTMPQAIPISAIPSSALLPNHQLYYTCVL